MTIDDQIRDDELQYDIKREAAEISASSSGKIDNHEYLAGEGILPSNERQRIEPAKFTYLHQEKHLKSKKNKIEQQERKMKD